MRNPLIAIALSLASFTSAYASNWHYVVVGNDETYFYFDADTIEKNKDRTILLWIKTVQATKPEKDGSWASAYRWKINCSKNTIQTQMWSTYDQNGNFLKSSSTIGIEAGVFPDSTGEGMLKIACTPSFPNEKSGTKYFKLENNDPLLWTRNFVEFNKSQVDNAPR